MNDQKGLQSKIGFDHLHIFFKKNYPCIGIIKPCSDVRLEVVELGNESIDSAVDTGQHLKHLVELLLWNVFCTILACLMRNWGLDSAYLLYAIFRCIYIFLNLFRMHFCGLDELVWVFLFLIIDKLIFQVFWKDIWLVLSWKGLMRVWFGIIACFIKRIMLIELSWLDCNFSLHKHLFIIAIISLFHRLCLRILWNDFRFFHEIFKLICSISSFGIFYWLLFQRCLPFCHSFTQFNHKL